MSPTDRPESIPGRVVRYRTLFRLGILAALAVHAALLAFLVIPTDGRRIAAGRVSVVPIAPVPDRPPRRRVMEPPSTSGESGAEGPASERTEPRPATRDRPSIPIPVPSADAPPEGTIPETALRAFEAAPMPLEAGPAGIRRRTPDPGSPALARARAESLANARLADLPNTERRDRGTVSLADGGGVRIGIPWQGFLPEDRRDETWREERCSGEEEGEADKPGEAEARRAQCE
ncbi:MAG: hypothetical protein R3199_06760 [Gemmatimonadota bacterium]|nr:hypothetical protein [Gemmatimonadota bacterium]